MDDEVADGDEDDMQHYLILLLQNNMQKQLIEKRGWQLQQINAIPTPT